jgi:hypothetical protein
MMLSGQNGRGAEVSETFVPDCGEVGCTLDFRHFHRDTLDGDQVVPVVEPHDDRDGL